MPCINGSDFNALRCFLFDICMCQFSNTLCLFITKLYRFFHIYQNITNILALVGMILTIPYPFLRKIQANLYMSLGLIGFLSTVHLGKLERIWYFGMFSYSLSKNIWEIMMEQQIIGILRPLLWEWEVGMLKLQMAM